MRVTSIWQKILSLIVTPHDEILEVYEVVTSPVKREVVGSIPTSLEESSCSSVGKSAITPLQKLLQDLIYLKPVEITGFFYHIAEISQGSPKAYRKVEG